MLDRRSFVMSALSFSGFVLGGCSSEDDGVTSSGRVSPDELMAEQALPDMATGNPMAPVTVVEYASMTCGFCRRFHLETYADIKEAFVDTGRVRFVVREFPFDPRATAAAMLIRCTPETRRDAMTDVLYEKQSDWARAENGQQALFDIARLAGFTQEEFRACLTDQDLLYKVKTVARAGQDYGVDSTPTFFVNGERYPGHKTVEEMTAILETAGA